MCLQYNMHLEYIGSNLDTICVPLVVASRESKSYQTLRRKQSHGWIFSVEPAFQTGPK